MKVFEIFFLLNYIGNEVLTFAKQGKHENWTTGKQTLSATLSIPMFFPHERM